MNDDGSALASEAHSNAGADLPDLVHVCAPVQADGSVSLDLEHPDGSPASPPSSPAARRACQPGHQAGGEASTPEFVSFAEFVKGKAEAEADTSIAMEAEMVVFQVGLHVEHVSEGESWVRSELSLSLEL